MASRRRLTALAAGSLALAVAACSGGSGGPGRPGGHGSPSGRGTPSGAAGTPAASRPGSPAAGPGGPSSPARPSYQQGLPGVAAAHRVIPDISMDASCASGMAAFGAGHSASPKPGWFVACGTSLSTPLLAGLVALAGQQAGHSLGLINPALYRMAAARGRGIVDVRRGDNSYPLSGVPPVKGFTASPGFDLTTGIGTVDAAYFVPELARLAG